MYEIFERLVKERGLTISQVCKETGIFQSVISQWKKRGTRLSAKYATILSDYFGVSIDYLMTGNEYYTNSETAGAAQEIFDTPGMRILFDAAKDSKPEDLKFAAEMLKRLKETNRDG